LVALSTGEKDSIAGLYSDENIASYNATLDVFGITNGVDKRLGWYQDTSSEWRRIKK
jgi:hypothetical protein